MDKRKAQLSSKLKEMMRSKSKVSWNGNSSNYQVNTSYQGYNRSNSPGPIEEEKVQSKFKIRTLGYSSPKKALIKNKINSVRSEDDEDNSAVNEVLAYKSQFYNPHEIKFEKKEKEPDKNQSKALQILEKLRAERMKQQEFGNTAPVALIAPKSKVK